MIAEVHHEVVVINDNTGTVSFARDFAHFDMVEITASLETDEASTITYIINIPELSLYFHTSEQQQSTKTFCSLFENRPRNPITINIYEISDAPAAVFSQIPKTLTPDNINLTLHFAFIRYRSAKD